MQPTPICIEINRHQIDWFNVYVFPSMELMAKHRNSIFTVNDVEFWNNVIVEYVLSEVVEKFRQKSLSKKHHLTVNLKHAQAYALYRFLFNYPVPVENIFEASTKQFIINQLHQQIVSVVVDG